MERSTEAELGDLPVLRRLAAGAEACYLGGTHWAHDREPGAHGEHFAGLWRTSEGVVAVVYPMESMLGEAAELLDVHTTADTIVVVEYAYALDGPELNAVDRARPGLAYSPSWAELAAHLGAPVPWWPSALRRPDHLTGWRPGDEPRPVEVVTYPSWEALYALAEREAAHVRKGRARPAMRRLPGLAHPESSARRTTWGAGKLRTLPTVAAYTAPLRALRRRSPKVSPSAETSWRRRRRRAGRSGRR
ncbi:hypothetical protein ACLGI4_28470 [Streptomyces sp. HMX112]|uniref:hypothetical protein n=1 Tax=Streptomyces sp. HMX112 TaxID=3390850 RepID=UPI003A7F79CE